MSCPRCGKAHTGQMGSLTCRARSASRALKGRSARVELCKASGCGKPTWNGLPGEYCSLSCKARSAPLCKAPLPLCKAPGCVEPTWNGLPGEYCSRSCKARNAPRCKAPGCGEPTWNGMPGEYCSKSCRRADKGGTDSRSSSCTPRPGSVPPSLSRPISSISRKFEPTQLSTTDQDYIDILNQCTKSWSGTIKMPKIDAIWNVTNPALRAKYELYCSQDGLRDASVYGHGKNPGNRQRRMHGSMMTHKFDGTVCTVGGCKVCCIMRNGFNMQYVQKGCFFGHGIYSTASFSTACRYAKKKGSSVFCGAVLICSVACGSAELIDGATLSKTTHLVDSPQPPNFHSRVIDAPHKSKSYQQLAAQHGGPLLESVDEIVVFHDDAICPSFLVVFEDTGK